jgi:uncharacterized 2Fe-2S/4Fe-4S cluster protein (DUF4445 family)
MPEVFVHDRGLITHLKALDGENLFMLLRDHGFQVYSPCGGKGSCGKCLVHVRGYGDVTACLFPVVSSIEVVMPYQNEARILTAQHDLTLDLPLQPGPVAKLSDRPLGLAIDLGTTTLVFYLVDLISGMLIETRSMLNPQAAFGQDVITRIQHASTDTGLQKLHQVIIGAINSQAGLFLQRHQLTPENLVKIMVAGNNTMLHLLLGEDPSSMGQAPYTPRFTAVQVKSGKDLGMLCHKQAEITLLPSVSAFVGSDIIAGLGSINFPKIDANCLFVDLGTNGELALVTPPRIWCCATAAGPVFEGANISCGVGGVEGAIAEFSESGMEIIGDEKPLGICGSGLVDVIALLLDKGLIDSTGLMMEDFEIVPEEASASGRSIFVNQEDVRQVQLAKSAIATGISLLLRHAGLVHNDIDALFLAGGFGNYLNVDNAMKIGLLPAQLQGKVISLGNTAGTGALLAIKSLSFRDVLDSILHKAWHIELSEDENFPLEYAMNMNF